MTTPGPPAGRRRRRVRGWVPLLAVVAVLAVLGGVGWLLPGGADPTPAADVRAVSASGEGASPSTAAAADDAAATPVPSTTAPASTTGGAPATPDTATSSAPSQPSGAPAPVPAPAPAPAAAAAATPVPGAPDQGVEDQVTALVNEQRAVAGCPPVAADEALARVARAHSADMGDRGYFSHTSPEGLSPFDRAAAAGVPGSRAENIAMGQPDAAAVMTAWMSSPGHRANILDCSLTRLGVGVAQGSGGPWWTQLFGS